MYIELFLLDNMVMDGLILRVAAALVRRPAGLLRTAIFSLLGAIYAAAAMMTPLLSSLPMKLASCLLMAFALKNEGWRSYALNCAALLAAVLLTGGVVLAVALLMGGDVKNGCVLAPLPLRAALAGALFVSFVPNIIRRMRSALARENGRVTVTVHAGGKRLALCGMTDSGNLLTEPVSGLPVVVAYAPELRGLAHIPIPAATAGGDAVLYALRPDKLLISVPGAVEREAAALVALTDTPLRDISALVPPEI